MDNDAEDVYAVAVRPATLTLNTRILETTHPYVSFEFMTLRLLHDSADGFDPACLKSVDTAKQ